MKNKKTAVLPLLLGMTAALCVSPVSGMDFSLDYARFEASQGLGFLELYMAVPRSGLTYTPDGLTFRAGLGMNVRILLGDSTVLDQSWERTDTADSPASVLPGQVLNEVHSVFLKSGSYTVLVRITDQAGSGKKEKRFEINIPCPETGLSLSDIQLASSITGDQAADRFVKNGFRILPLPGAVYGSTLPVLFYYAEIYRLSPLSPGADSTYSVAVRFMNDRGRCVREMPERTKRRMAASVVEMGNALVGSFETGVYRIRINVRDNASLDSIEAEKPFYVFRPQDTGRSPQVTGTAEPVYREFLGLDEQDLNIHFEYARFIATGEESKIFKKLDETGKRKFLEEFWIKRDPDVLTPQNERKQEYYSRIRLAENRYSALGRPGWKTDRGRVLLLYGEPDEIRRNPVGSWGKPYEIWRFNKIEAGALFVFADETGSGDYRLVHSTASNEIHDVQWESVMY
ncbi:GWxTD domain-containing protein [bacterium]|nr:GWxTD domain-containing protein [bacterium]